VGYKYTYCIRTRTVRTVVDEFGFDCGLLLWTVGAKSLDHRVLSSMKDDSFFVINAPWDRSVRIANHVTHFGYAVSFLAAVCIIVESFAIRNKWTSASRIMLGDVAAALVITVAGLPGTTTAEP